MKNLLEVEDLTIKLVIEGEHRTVLHDVNLTLGEGETVGMVGESGSGKSMTARAIAQLLPPGARTTGRIRFDGASVLDLRGTALRKYRRNDVAMVFQDARSAINPVRSIGDFLTEIMRIADGVKPSAANAKAVQLLAEVGIEDGERRLKQYPHELSGGLLQRVMIAATVAARPRLILADEPTTALDVTTQAEVMAILADLRAEYGMAMLFITHDLELASAVCDETVVMYAGTVMEKAPSKHLHAQPLHPYTAALMKARPEITHTAARLEAISGSPTTAYEAPEGCAFAPRCGFAQPECSSPVQLITIDGAATACRRSSEVRDLLLTSGPTQEVVR